jgi:hypothetical protein
MEQSDRKGKAVIDNFDNAAEVRSFRATPAQGFGVAHAFAGIVGRQQGPPPQDPRTSAAPPAR